MKRLIALILAALLMLSACMTALAQTYKDKGTVKQVQQALNDAGYNCGKPDGSAGKKTKAAITQYQTDKGLEATGVIDDALLESLGVEVSEEIKAQQAAEEVRALYDPEVFVEELYAAFTSRIKAEAPDGESEELQAIMEKYKLERSKAKGGLAQGGFMAPNILLFHWFLKDKKRYSEPLVITISVSDGGDEISHFSYVQLEEAVALACRTYGLNLEDLPEVKALLADEPAWGETVSMNALLDAHGAVKVIHHGEFLIRFVFNEDLNVKENNGIWFAILKEEKQTLYNTYMPRDILWYDVSREEWEKSFGVTKDNQVEEEAEKPEEVEEEKETADKEFDDMPLSDEVVETEAALEEVAEAAEEGEAEKAEEDEVEKVEGQTEEVPEVFSDMPPLPDEVVAVVGQLPTSLDQVSDSIDWQSTRELCNAVKPLDAIDALLESGSYSFELGETKVNKEEMYAGFSWYQTEGDAQNFNGEDAEMKISISDGVVTLTLDKEVPKDAYKYNFILSENVDAYIEAEKYTSGTELPTVRASKTLEIGKELEFGGKEWVCSLDATDSIDSSGSVLYTFYQYTIVGQEGQGQWYVFFNTDGTMEDHKYYS